MDSVSGYIQNSIYRIESGYSLKKLVSSKMHTKIEDYIEDELFDILWDNVGGKIKCEL